MKAQLEHEISRLNRWIKRSKDSEAIAIYKKMKDEREVALLSFYLSS